MKSTGVYEVNRVNESTGPWIYKVYGVNESMKSTGLCVYGVYQVNKVPGVNKAKR